jgi:hypothetical protein
MPNACWGWKWSCHAGQKRYSELKSAFLNLPIRLRSKSDNLNGETYQACWSNWKDSEGKIVAGVPGSSRIARYSTLCRDCGRGIAKGSDAHSTAFPQPGVAGVNPLLALTSY